MVKSRFLPFLFVGFGLLLVSFALFLLTQRLIFDIAGVWGFVFVVSGIIMFYQDRGDAQIKYRRRNGMCIQCGYDLRAHNGPGYRCPECGKVHW